MTPLKDNTIDEKTSIKYSLKTIVTTFITVIIFVGGVVLGYASIINKIDSIDLKVDKTDFNKHTYSDSLRFEYFIKDIKKDLRDIKKSLNIKEEK